MWQFQMYHDVTPCYSHQMPQLISLNIRREGILGCSRCPPILLLERQLSSGHYLIIILFIKIIFRAGIIMYSGIIIMILQLFCFSQRINFYFYNHQPFTSRMTYEELLSRRDGKYQLKINTGLKSLFEAFSIKVQILDSSILRYISTSNCFDILTFQSRSTSKIQLFNISTCEIITF